MIEMSTSFRNFLRNSDCRVAQLLYNAHLLEYPSYNLIVTTEQINYITFRTDGTISYLPAKKEHIVNEDGTWNRKNRQSGSPGKVIRKLFTPKALKILKDSDFECFNNEYKAKYNDEGFKFELWDRNRIPEAYEMKRREGGGTLNGSCMHYGYNVSDGQDEDDDDTWSSEWFEIYRNCKYANILVLLDKKGLLCGRALVWKLADGVTIMDRVYTAQDYMDDLFLNHAAENGWLRKVNYKSKDSKTYFMQPDGVAIYKNIHIETDTDFRYYPYIDTFTYGNSTGIRNYPNDTHLIFDQTGGDHQNDTNDNDDEEDDHSGERWDEIDERWIDEDDAVTIERGIKRGYCTHTDNTVDVGNYTYWDQDPDITYLDYDNNYYLKSDVVYSEHDCCDYPEDECVHSNRGWILESDATEIDGKWYHDEDVVYSRYSKETYLKKDCVWSEYHHSHILEEDAVKVGDDWIHVDEAPKEEVEKNWIDIDDRVTNPHDPNQLKLELQH